ncbi:MAG: hypothetical protein U0172_14085 [Nitrospiraceae bacterium]
MGLSHSDATAAPTADLSSWCATLATSLERDGLRQSTDAAGDGGFNSTFRLSPTPYLISQADLAFFTALGPQLLAFYRALNRLYQDSVRGAQPSWVADYLDRGKPESLIAYSRMNRLKSHLPRVIRPDILPTDRGMVMTELDSVPGGIGLTAALAQAYAVPQPTAPTSWSTLVGETDGMVQGFRRLLEGAAGSGGLGDGLVAIVVSDEAKDYRQEMHWLAHQLSQIGCATVCLEPRDVRFTEDGLYTQVDGTDRPIRVLYRFFELFDLKNIPKAELILYSAKKGQVAMTPPAKPAFEEKLAFALFHHPRLAAFWERKLGTDTHCALQKLFPQTWILDPRPIAPVAVIPGLTIGVQPVGDWTQLATAGQKDRQLVVKPSGFSELAWGSRGVSIGHDMPQDEWQRAVTAGLAAFDQSPHLVQAFHKSRSVKMEYYDPATASLQSMQGRARLCPYYFVTGEQADRVELGGILATVCPADKKILHGMRDAIMAPCAVAPPRATNGAVTESATPRT